MRRSLACFVLPLLALSGCLAQPIDDDGEDTMMTEEGIIATLGTAGIDTSKTTHLIVIGYSHGQGTQFALAAMARARRYRALYPDHQIVFFGAIESGGGRTDTQVLGGLGAKVISDDPDEKFYDDVLVKRMKAFKALASFDFYGHSSPWNLGVEATGTRLGTFSSVDLTAVRNSFTSDAYATLNGCNAGRVLAPVLSEAWQIPVSGALTGSNFQALHSDGRWYVADPGRAPSTAWANTNGKSFSTPVACSQGACLRLKPENAPYHGYWGDFEGGLGHYQFFCNHASAASDCGRRMAMSLVASVSVEPLSATSSREAFERVVLDWLCPNDATSVRFEACRTGLREAALSSQGFSSFRGKPLECTDAGCVDDMTCETDAYGSPKPGTCSDDVVSASEPMTQVREYQRYMAGFDALQSGPAEPALPTSGPIDEGTLASWPQFEVVAGALNCRQTAYTGAVVHVFQQGETLTAQASTGAQPRVVSDSRGKPWLLVLGEAATSACYVSASYEYIRPAG
jgi:hypothetical protein